LRCRHEPRLSVCRYVVTMTGFTRATVVGESMTSYVSFRRRSQWRRVRFGRDHGRAPSIERRRSCSRVDSQDRARFAEPGHGHNREDAGGVAGDLSSSGPLPISAKVDRWVQPQANPTTPSNRSPLATCRQSARQAACWAYRAKSAPVMGD